MHHALAFAAALLPLLLQAKENPEFTYWAEHQAGSWVKFKMDMDAPGETLLVETQHTHLETGADKVVVEQKSKVTLNGRPQPDSSEKEAFFKDKEKNPIKIEKAGDEEIEAGGKQLKCHWIEGAQKDATKVKFWFSKDSPGGVAKGEVSGGATPGLMKLTATSWEKK